MARNFLSFIIQRLEALVLEFVTFALIRPSLSSEYCQIEEKNLILFCWVFPFFVVEILKGGGWVWGSGVLMYLFHAYWLIAILYCKHTHKAALKQELIKTNL